MQAITELADWCHHHDVTLLQHLSIWIPPAWPLLSNKVNLCNGILVKERKWEVLWALTLPLNNHQCQWKDVCYAKKLYLKCVIKLVKRCSKRLGYGSLSNLISATTGGCLQMIQFSITWPDKFFPQLCPSLNMTFLANFRSSPHSMGTLYSNKKKFLSIEMCILLKHISENGQFLLD